MKNLQNLGKALNKADQKLIIGGLAERFCTNCGYFNPNEMVCYYAPNWQPQVISCIPR